MQFEPDEVARIDEGLAGVTSQIASLDARVRLEGWEYGLHVHMVTNERIDVVQARALAEKAGWGRIHVTVMPAEHARYLAKYLSKERPPCLKRWRLWAAFGEGWEPTKVKDLIKESLFSTVYRACKEWQGWTGKGHFLERLDLPVAWSS